MRSSFPRKEQTNICIKPHRASTSNLILFKTAAARSRCTDCQTCLQWFRNYVSALNSSTPLLSVYKVSVKSPRKFHRDPSTILLFGPSPSDIYAPGAVADILWFHFASCSRESLYLSHFVLCAYQSGLLDFDSTGLGSTLQLPFYNGGISGGFQLF